MALTNAEKQANWREKRNEAAKDWEGTPAEFVESLLARLGAKKARKVARLLEVRLRNLKPDCYSCDGTGFRRLGMSTACGMPMYTSSGKRWVITQPCDCSPAQQAADRAEDANPTKPSCALP